MKALDHLKLHTLSDDALMNETEKAVDQDFRSTAVVVKCFQEIYERKLYLEKGFPSLFEMATKHFGNCAGSAQRRINSMKLARVSNCTQ